MTGAPGSTARRAGRWRRAVIVAGVLALGTAPSACTGSGHAGAGAVHPARASAAASVRPRPSASPSPSPSVRLVVEASGDLLIHSPVFDRALVLGGGRRYDFAPMFAQVKPYIQGADLALCHVETPMTPAPPTGYPTFNTPPALAATIRQTGWRACSTAGTHSLDRGQTGVDDTIRALDQAGVAHTGTFSSAAAQKTPLIMTVKGVRVAFLAYTELTNGIPSPHPWSVNRTSAAQILSDARRARLDGAQAVIVNLHWGDQYVAQPSSFQLALAGQLTRSPDITAVVGQHVHIVQPVRVLNGKLVVFGEGNLISNQTGACCPAGSQDGMIVLLTITVDGRGARVTFIRYVPVWVRHPDYVVLPAGVAWRTDHADAAALRASYERTVAVVGRGPFVQPVPAHLLPRGWQCLTGASAGNVPAGTVPCLACLVMPGRDQPGNPVPSSRPRRQALSSSGFLERTNATVTSEASERRFSALERGAAGTDAVSGATLPLAKLPGAQRDSVACYNTSGGFLPAPAGQVVENARAAAGRGTGGIEVREGRMLVPGRPGLGFTLSDQARAWTAETGPVWAKLHGLPARQPGGFARSAKSHPAAA